MLEKEKLRSLKVDPKSGIRSLLTTWIRPSLRKKSEIEQFGQTRWHIRTGEDEIIRRKQYSIELLRALIWKEKLLYHKAKTKWILERDVSSNFFHNWVKFKFFSQLSQSEAETIRYWRDVFDKIWRESVDGVKNGMYNFFTNHFSKKTGSRPRMPTELFSNKVGKCENEFLIASFAEEEIKQVVRSCDSNKSPGLDDFTFGFLKGN